MAYLSIFYPLLAILKNPSPGLEPSGLKGQLFITQGWRAWISFQTHRSLPMQAYEFTGLLAYS